MNDQGYAVLYPSGVRKAAVPGMVLVVQLQLMAGGRSGENGLDVQDRVEEG